MNLSKLTAFIATVLVALFASSAFAQTLVVGGKNFNEQFLIAEMTS